MLDDFFKNNVSIINSWIKDFLEKNSSKNIIHEAIEYSIFNGGKRLRPILANTFYNMYKKDNFYDEDIKYLAVGLEFIHTYSLIHDDLPSMDNDDYRRGNLTCHKKYNEAIAILAGDALLTEAFRCFSEIKNKNILEIINLISNRVGANGMIKGQVLDILNENISKGNKNNKFLLRTIHARKTGDLILVSIVSGAMLSNNIDEKNIILIKKYAINLGHIFQITDDILDIVGDKKLLGKRGSDLDNQKLTYPSVYGIEKSKKFVLEYKKHTKNLIDKMDIKNEYKNFLSNLLDYIGDRCY